MSKELKTLQNAAKDINDVLKPDPQIDVDGLSQGDLEEELKELLPQVKQGDELSVTTWAVLKKLGWKESEPEPAPVKEKDSKKTTKKKDEEEDDEEEVNKSKSSKKEHSGKAASFTEDSVITLKVKENPRREGTRVWKLFGKYRTGMTVAEALKAGLSRGNIRKDASRGSISLK